MQQQDIAPTSSIQPLVAYLAELPTQRVTMTFEDVEQILGHKLPSEAHAYRDWWTNDVMDAHSSAWIAAGWCVESAYIRTHVVTFRWRP